MGRVQLELVSGVGSWQATAWCRWATSDLSKRGAFPTPAPKAGPSVLTSNRVQGLSQSSTRREGEFAVGGRVKPGAVPDFRVSSGSTWPQEDSWCWP